MAEQVAITVVGRDRPGIVAGVSRVLFEHGCNIEDSSATILRDSFAMILIASLPVTLEPAALEASLQSAAGRLGIACDLRRLGPAAPRDESDGLPYTLSVYGADQPGIVYRVTSELASAGCNITDVRTRVVGSREAPVYLMILDLSLPESAEESDLETTLSRLRQDLRVDITLRPVDEATM